MRKGYAVMDENTLGVLFDMNGQEYIEVLHASVLRGAVHNWLNGPVLTAGHITRRATAQDFDAFRVKLPPNFKEDRPASG